MSVDAPGKATVKSDMTAQAYYNYDYYQNDSDNDNGNDNDNDEKNTSNNNNLVGLQTVEKLALGDTILTGDFSITVMLKILLMACSALNLSDETYTYNVIHNT